MEVFLFIYIVNGVIFGIACDKIIKNKGYYDNWFWWGFFFGIVALIVAAVKPENQDNYNSDSTSSYYNIDRVFSDENNTSQQGVDITLKAGGWKCGYCYRVNPSYVGTCACGKSKQDTQNLQEMNRRPEDTKTAPVLETAVSEEKEKLTVQTNNEEHKIGLIKKYKELLDMGAISQDEFNQKKEELLFSTIDEKN